MRRCSRVRPNQVSATPLSSTPRRWKSYDRESLSDEALLPQLEEGLGDSADSPRLDLTRKSVRTAAGELPISPLFDPKWIASGRRTTKSAPPKKPSGRFRSKVYNNPYARALETPLRRCTQTKSILPRFFLQDFESIKHPTTGKPWWAPGPLSFRHLDTDKYAAAKKSAEALKTAGVEREAQENEHATNESTTASRYDIETVNDEQPAETAKISTDQAIDETNSLQEYNDSSQEPRAPGHASEPALRPQSRSKPGMPTAAPVVAYTVSRKSLLAALNPDKVRILSGRHGMSVDTTTHKSIWRADMADFLLTMLRQQAVDALIRRGTRAEHQDPHKFIEPCASWDQVKVTRLRGAVLWMPTTEVKTDDVEYPTLDIDATFGGKLAVFNLPRLLGQESVAKLKEEAPMFRDSELLVLKQWPTWSVRSIHMLLWRIQGYLAGTKERKSKPREVRGDQSAGSLEQS